MQTMNEQVDPKIDDDTWYLIDTTPRVICDVMLPNGFTKETTMNTNEWHSNDNAPHVICDVMLEDGMEVEAIYTDGHWEIVGGRIVDPLSFRLKEVVVFANN